MTTLKCLFVYKTAGNIRVKRLMTPITPITVADVKNISCEKLSSHIHLLSFDLETYEIEPLNTSINLIDEKERSAFELQEMILGQGFQILKVEFTKTNNKTSYTFFLQHNPHAPSQKHLFGSGVSLDPETYTPFFDTDEAERRKLWDQYENKSYPYDHH